MSSLTWTQIHSTNRHGFGAEKIKKNQLRREIPRGVTEEVELLVLRYSGEKHAMVGFRHTNVFNILFLDHDFTLYDHGS